MTYTVAAIPTMYRGRQYRSRLEAKWAAFFDGLNWTAEYEPYDMGPWSPDFLLKGEYAQQVLVEIKPIQEFSEAVAAKMVSAAHARSFHGHCDWLLLLGTSPRLDLNGIHLGWHTHVTADGRAKWADAWLTWVPLHDGTGAPRLGPDITVAIPEGGGWFHILNADDSRQNHRLYRYTDHTMGLWARATNAVQWRGEGAQP